MNTITTRSIAALAATGAIVAGGAAATGTLIRPETVRRYAREAGFAEVDVLPVDNASFRLYLLRP